MVNMKCLVLFFQKKRKKYTWLIILAIVLTCSKQNYNIELTDSMIYMDIIQTKWTG